MFDVSFAEVLVLVTGAGMLLGRQEIVAGSRMLGVGLGRMIGTLQGIKEKYEEKSRNSDIYKLHSSVRDGLIDMTTIGSDIVRIGYTTPMNSGIMRPTSALANSPTALTAPMASNQPQVSSIKLGQAAVSATMRGAATPGVDKLARLILVEDQLRQKRGQSTALEGRNSGADIVQSVVSESILANYYAEQMRKPS